MSAAEKVVELKVKRNPFKGRKWTQAMKDKARATREANAKKPSEPKSVRSRDASLYLEDAERRLAQIELPVKASRQMKVVRALLTLARDSLS